MSSKRAIRRRMCGRKQRFATQDEAVARLRTVQRAGRAHGGLTPYRCGFCGGFHFGHPPANVRRAISASRFA